MCWFLFLIFYVFTDVNGINWYSKTDHSTKANPCMKEGYFPDPGDCKRFYRCVDIYGNGKFVKYDYKCPSNTVYDVKYTTCNHSESANVAPGCSQDMETPPFGESEKYCHYELFLSYLYTEAPDGVQKRILAFNNTFPGPLLTCTRGKIMFVKVTNLIQEPDNSEPTSIHWHGIEQNLSPFYDGPESITQCGIVKNSSMIYEFQLFQAGTYWYHSHHSYQYVDGAWGPLIVRNIVPPSNRTGEIYEEFYDEELVITINDWHHCNANNLSIKWLESPRNFPIPDTTLINGKGVFNCSNSSPLKCSNSCDPSKQGPTLFKVKKGKTYRIRLINTSASQAYRFSIDNHRFLTIETDGVDTVMVGPSDLLDIHVAQRYSILVKMNQSSHESFWINAVSITGNTEARAVLEYVEDPIYPSPPIGQPGEPALPNVNVIQGRPSTSDINWDQLVSQGGAREFQNFRIRNGNLKPISYPRTSIRPGQKVPTTRPIDPSIAIQLDQMQCFPFSSRGEDVPPSYFDHQFVLNFTGLCPDGTPGTKLCFNPKPFQHGHLNSTPALFQMIKGIEISEGFRPIFTPKLRDVIEVVINNNGGIHPWHFHGHTFWVIKTGKTNDGFYDPSKPYNVTRTVRRDTTHTNPRSHVIIRYVVDNPGAWIFHCHINWHLEAGLAVTFIEAQDLAQKVYSNIPKNAKEVCSRAGVNLY